MGPIAVPVSTWQADQAALDKIVGGFEISDNSLSSIVTNIAAINADTNVTLLAATSGAATLPDGHPIAAPAFSLSGSGTMPTVPWFMLYAGALTVGSGATISVTSGATMTTTGAFSASGGATVNLSGGYLTAAGTNSFSGATVTGAYTFMDTGTTSVSGLTIGGTATFENNSALTQNGGTVTVGDAEQQRRVPVQRRDGNLRHH